MLQVPSSIIPLHSTAKGAGQSPSPYIPGLEWGGTAEVLSRAHAAPQQGVGALVRFPGAQM